MCGGLLVEWQLIQFPAHRLVLLTVVLSFLWILVIIRYYAYWFVAELPLAIEPTKSAIFSFSRSRQLNEDATRRVGLIITIAFLITLPINVIDSVPSFVGQTISNPILSPDPSAQLIGGALVFATFLSIPQIVIDDRFNHLPEWHNQ